MNLNYHIPSAKELNNVTRFVHDQLTQSMNFLNDAILLKKRKPDGHKFTSEETYRELTYINNINYASSRLLKRPYLGRKKVTEHLDTTVEIGYDDLAEKGLGFELINVLDDQHFNDPRNMYYGLTQENREILLNMRLTLIEFIVKLAGE